MTEMEYNTTRPKMEIPEYGRNVQKMIDHTLTIADKEERNLAARSIIKVMAQLAPHLRDLEDFEHKLWTHLHIMSEFQLEVDSPYPKPKPESFTTRPNTLDYPQSRIRYGHYGKTIQDMIRKAVEMEDEKEKEILTLDLANLMKRMYLTWNRDTVTDDLIIKQLKELSGGKLTLPEETELISTNEVVKQRPQNNRNKKRSNHRNRKRRN